MGSDYFAVLKFERRPWIDLDQLKHEYQQRTLAAHPDRSKTADADVDFAMITEAYRALNSPRLRLQHLLALEGDSQSRGEPTAVPGELSNLFMEAAQLVGEVNSFLQKREQASSTLGKSLLQPELAGLRGRIDVLLRKLDTQYAEALNDLRTVDEAWPSNRAHAVTEIKPLAQRFAFLERWLDQLREKEFQLST